MSTCCIPKHGVRHRGLVWENSKPQHLQLQTHSNSFFVLRGIQNDPNT